jgi:5,10-methylenetetrahydromethanopterin reductase
MTEISIAMDGRAPIADIPAQARAAEEGGANTLWIACHLFLRDPITTAAIALGATSRIKIALMAMSPYSVHPVFTAMAAATLDEMYPGRVILSLGAGAPADLKAAGIDAMKPLATLSEAMAVSRAMFAGELVNFHGKTFQVQGRRLVNGGRKIPIVLAASRPNMLALAGKSSDGVLISAATAPAFICACLDHAEKGAAGRHFGKFAVVYTQLGESEKAAIDRLRRAMGFVLRGPHHAENIRLSGAPLDQAALWNAYAAENWAEVDRLVNDDVVRRHAACGTPAQVRAKLEEYRVIGLDEIILGALDDASSIAAALAAARG